MTLAYIKRVGKATWIAYAAWIDDGGVERLLVGGVLFSMLALHLITLNEVLTASEAEGIAPGMSLLLLLIVWYIFQPVSAYKRGRDYTAEDIEAMFP